MASSPAGRDVEVLVDSRSKTSAVGSGSKSVNNILVSIKHSITSWLKRIIILPFDIGVASL